MCGCVSIFQEQKPYVRLKINVKLGIDVSFTHHVLEKVIKCPLEILWLFFPMKEKLLNNKREQITKDTTSQPNQMEKRQSNPRDNT